MSASNPVLSDQDGATETNHDSRQTVFVGTSSIPRSGRSDERRANIACWSLVAAYAVLLAVYVGGLA